MTRPERVWTSAAEHVEVYRRTGGAEGHWWAGRPHLLLGTTGRRTGRPHTVPLVYGRTATSTGEQLVVAASAGGAERHPAWYLNLLAHPVVAVQLLERTWSARAHPAEGADEEQAWQALGGTWKGFLRYRGTTRRRIPVVLLGPPPGADALP